jgi:hypothetical protein
MSTNNQPRADAVLKNLPPERQHEIWLRRTEGKKEDRGQAAIQGWLAQDGLKVSRRSLSEFFSWYADRLALKESGDTLEAFEEFLRKQKPGWTADKIRDTAIQFFISQTVGQKDLYKFATVVQLDQNERFGRTKGAFKEREISLKEKKFYFDAVAACRKQLPALKAIEANKSFSEEQKTQMFMEKLFGPKPQ